MPIRTLSLLLVLAAGARAADGDVIAVVDGVPAVTAADFAFYYARAAAEGGEAPAPRDVLDDAVTGQVLAREAEAAGLAGGADVAAAVESYRRQMLRDYSWRSVEEGVTVSDDEVRAFFEKRSRRRLYSFVETDDPARAAAALAALRSGRSWDEVVAEYSIFTAYGGPGGAWEVPMEFSGDDASVALFALAPGAFTDVVAAPNGLAWFIYRCDKVVHGDGVTFEQAQPALEAAVRAVKVERRWRELAAAWRRDAPITRDAAVWADVNAQPFADLETAYYGRGQNISEVGGVAVPFDGVFAEVARHLARPPAEVDAFRAARPDQYRRMWEYYLGAAEDVALLEYEASREGADRAPEFARALAARRAGLLVDKLYETGFLAAAAEPSAAEVAAYYDAHRADFYVPERVEVYVAAIRERAAVEAFYREVRDGGDLVVLGEARNRAREAAERVMEDLPPAPPPAAREWYGTVAIAAAATPANTPRDAAPSADELRARVYPFRGLDQLSDVFRLADGRWAFYKTIYHEPARQRGLDEAEVTYYCREAAWRERLESPAGAAAVAAWLAAVKARHAVAVDEASFAAAVRALPAAGD